MVVVVGVAGKEGAGEEGAGEEGVVGVDGEEEPVEEVEPPVVSIEIVASMRRAGSRTSERSRQIASRAEDGFVALDARSPRRDGDGAEFAAEAIDATNDIKEHTTITFVLRRSTRRPVPLSIKTSLIESQHACITEATILSQLRGKAQGPVQFSGLREVLDSAIVALSPGDWDDRRSELMFKTPCWRGFLAQNDDSPDSLSTDSGRYIAWACPTPGARPHCKKKRPSL